MSGYSSSVFAKLENRFMANKKTEVEESNSFEMWKKIPFSFKIKIHFADLSDLDDAQKGSKPDFDKMESNIYNVFGNRERVALGNENTTFEYTRKINYYFKQEAEEENLIKMINFALGNMPPKFNKAFPMTLSNLDNSLPYWYQEIKNMVLTNAASTNLLDGLKIMGKSKKAGNVNHNKDFFPALHHHLNDTDVGFHDMASSTNHSNEIQGSGLLIMSPNFPQVPDFLFMKFCHYFSQKCLKEMETKLCEKSNDEDELPAPDETMDVIPYTPLANETSQETSRLKKRFEMDLLLNFYDNDDDLKIFKPEEKQTTVKKSKISDVLKLVMIIGMIILLGITFILTLAAEKVLSYRRGKNVSAGKNLRSEKCFGTYFDLKINTDGGLKQRSAWKDTT